ncbi:MAG: hypothetical protein IKZ87_01280 [Actinomycetaceae bacterium]|nr:hypothetical protein [Actinomycetaceae bacterium]
MRTYVLTFVSAETSPNGAVTYRTGPIMLVGVFLDEDSAKKAIQADLKASFPDLCGGSDAKIADPEEVSEDCKGELGEFVIVSKSGDKLFGAYEIHICETGTLATHQLLEGLPKA